MKCTDDYFLVVRPASYAWTLTRLYLLSVQDDYAWAGTTLFVTTIYRSWTIWFFFPTFGRTEVVAIIITALKPPPPHSQSSSQLMPKGALCLFLFLVLVDDVVVNIGFSIYFHGEIYQLVFLAISGGKAMSKKKQTKVYYTFQAILLQVYKSLPPQYCPPYLYSKYGKRRGWSIDQQFNWVISQYPQNLTRR